MESPKPLSVKRVSKPAAVTEETNLEDFEIEKIDTPPVDDQPPVDNEQDAKPYVEPPAPRATALKVIHDFKAAVNGSPLLFKKDQLIFDSLIIKTLLENDMPVLPANEKIDFECCPKCHHKYVK